MRKKISNMNVIVKGIITSVFVFCLGFGVLFIFYINWSANNPSSELPGLFAFRAASIGDSILLPIIAGGFVVYNQKIILERKQQLCKWFLVAISGIIGVFIQASWLINDDTSLNWTIPKVHYFNFAGWYHAFFFVFMIVIITLGMVNMYFTDKYGEEEKSKKHYIADFLIWFCGSLFLNLHIIDDYNNNSFVLLYCALFFVCMVTLLKLFAYNRNLKVKYFVHSIVAIILSYSISKFLLLKNIEITSNFFLVLSSLFLCVLFVAPSVLHKKEMVKIFAFLIVSIVPLQFLIICSSDYGEFLVYLIFILISSIIVPILQLEICGIYTAYGKNKKAVDEIIQYQYTITVQDVMAYMFVGLTSQISIALIGFFSTDILNLSNYADIVNNLLGIITSTTIPPYIYRTFSYVIDSENVNGKDASEKWRIVNYSVYVLIFIGSLFIILYSLVHSYTNAIGTSYHIAFPYLRAVLLILSISLIGVFICIIKNNRRIVSAIFVLVLSFASYVSVVLIIIFTNNMVINLWMLFNYRSIIMAVSSLAFTFIVSYGYYNNKIYLRNRKFDFVALCESVIILIGTLSISFVNIVYLTISLSVLNILLFICSTFIASILLPFILCQNDYCERKENDKLLKNQAKEGVMQDGFLYGTATIVCQLLTIILLPAKYSTNFNEFFIPILSAFLFSSVLIGPIGMCIKNNINHYSSREREFKRLSKIEQNEELRRMIKLKHYLSVQNIVTLLVVFPYSLVTLFNLITQCVKDKKKGLKGTLICKD